MPSKPSNHDLVSRGPYNSGSNNQCWGAYNSDTKIAYGPGNQYACIHSGLIESVGGTATAWYNYALASAGTITDENTTEQNPVTNTNPATESICPKGWTLPAKTQIDNNRNINIFSPILGGYYANGAPYNDTTRGYWWGSTAYNAASRYYLYYSSDTLSTGSLRRHAGYFIRCINKQKTVLDLTYMQEMMPEPLDYFLGLVDYRKASI